MAGQLGQDDRVHRYRDELNPLQDLHRRIDDIGSTSKKVFFALQDARDDLKRKREDQEKVVRDIEGWLAFVETVITYFDETAPCTWGHPSPLAEKK